MQEGLGRKVTAWPFLCLLLHNLIKRQEGLKAMDIGQLSLLFPANHCLSAEIYDGGTRLTGEHFNSDSFLTRGLASASCNQRIESNCSKFLFACH